MAAVYVTSSPGPIAEQLLLCPMCDEVFRSPKILPCFHTFCQDCLQDLVKQGSPTHFACPQCHEQVQVPSGGVGEFHTNPYIDREALDRARSDEAACGTHLDRKAEMYCTNCDAPICLTCFATKHRYHNHTDIANARMKLRSRIDEGKPRLSRIISNVKADIWKAKQERQATEEKRAALRETILRRHAVLQTAIDKYRDEALASVDKVTDNLLATQDGDIVTLTDQLDSMAKLQQRVEESLEANCMADLGLAAKDMTFGRGSQQAEVIMATRQGKTTSRPVLRFSGTTHNLLQSLRAYMGHAVQVNLTVPAPEAVLDKEFVCKKEPDGDIYHLCPTTDDKVVVSFEPYRLRDEPVINVFTTDGDFVKAVTLKVPERMTPARQKNGRVMYRAATGSSVYRFAKKCDRDLAKMFVLEIQAQSPGKANVLGIVVESEEPLVIEETDVCTIECISPRAFDVDESEQMFVVLEEALVPVLQRKVLLYEHRMQNSIDIYRPPLVPFQPSDVCFYTLGGQEVLLVADELNDAIHVVKVQGGRLIIWRFLATGCPLLVQPTALNTDPGGRLWVGCTGGRVLVFKPVDETRRRQVVPWEQPVCIPC